MRELGLKTTEYKKIPYPKNLGKRSKMGGKPEWIQQPKKMICQKCKKEMNFICQIDSIDYTGFPNENIEYLFGDVGMIYTFFCFDCLEVQSVFQTY